MYFQEYCLFHLVLRDVLHYCSFMIFYLDWPGAACLLLPRDVVELPPEVTLLLLLNDCTYFVECLLVFLFLCNFLLILKMFPLETFSVFLIKYAFPFTCIQSVCDLLYQHVEWVGDVAPLSCLFQFTLVLYFPFMKPEKWVVYLNMANPYCCFWWEWDATTLYLCTNSSARRM